MSAQLDLALAERDKGIARVKAKNSDFIETMRGVARRLARDRTDRTITADDLRIANVTSDPNLLPIPAAQQSEVVGMVAQVVHVGRASSLPDLGVPPRTDRLPGLSGHALPLP